MKTLRALDICSGAGGWAVAARGLPIEIVRAVDWWEPACKTYKLNHPSTEVICGDLSDAALADKLVKKSGDIDLILGGIPCEWLSSYRTISPVKAAELAGQQHLLDSCLAIVKRINPPWWCLEDVKQLTQQLPPMTPWVEVNARTYSAQRRKRVFVGWFSVPAPGTCKDVLEDRIRPGPYRISSRAFERTPQISRTFSSGFTLAAIRDRKAPTVMSMCSRRDAELVVVDDRIAGGKRQIEWQELASLQGFPTDYVFYGSPTDVGKMVGRAVQIDTGRAILKGICQAAGAI